MSALAVPAEDRAPMAQTGAEALAEFEQVLAEQRGRLFAIALSILRDPLEAEDAVQDAASAAWLGWATRAAPAATVGWLTTICVRTSLRRRRGVLRRLVLDRSLRDEMTRFDAHLEQDGRDVDLHRAHGRLSRQQRAVVSLHYSHGYTLKECADLMGCSPGSVATHLSRALARLRRELNDG